MKHIKLKDAEIFKKPTATVFEYHLPNKDINWALVDVKGRYPESGWARNNECKLMVYIVKGKGKLVVTGGGVIKFKKHDLVFVDAKTKYYWQANSRLGIACNPAWNPEQYESVGDGDS